MRRRRTIRYIKSAAAIGLVAALTGCAQFQNTAATNVDPLVDKACQQGPAVFPNAYDNDWRKTAVGNEWAVRCSK